MRYFITGGTGFIGSVIARQLRTAGHDVVALVRTPSKAAELRVLGVQLAEGDITNRESLRAPMSGCDGVFHVAAWYKVGERNTSDGEKINVEGTRNVLEMMRELEIPKGVYTSTVTVFSDTHGKLPDESYYYDGPHLSVYDRTKWEAHYKVALPMMRAGLPLVIVMPGLTYGPDDPSGIGDTFRSYLQKKLPMLPKQTAFSWAHVEDTARGHILAMEKGKPGETYIIAGEPHTFTDAFEVAERITGIRAPRIHAPPAMMKMMSGLTKVVGAVIPLPPMYSAEALRITAGVTYIGNNAKARRELGYSPRPLEQGLREMLQHEISVLAERKAAKKRP